MKTISNEEYRKNQDLTAMNLLAIEKKQMEGAIAIAPQLIKMLKEFDDKVYNVRFEKALKALSNSLWVEDDGLYFFNIYWIDFEHRDTADLNSDCGCVYIKSPCFNLLSIGYNGIIKNKRIVYSREIEKDINYSVANLKRTIAENDAALSRVEEFRNRKKAIEEDIESLKEDIPFDIQTYFNIKF